MKRVGIQEFERRASELLAENEALTVERHGKAVGVYLPVPSSPGQDSSNSVAALRAAVSAALEGSDLTQDELADLFDLRQPLP